MWIIRSLLDINWSIHDIISTAFPLVLSWLIRTLLKIFSSWRQSVLYDDNFLGTFLPLFPPLVAFQLSLLILSHSQFHFFSLFIYSTEWRSSLSISMDASLRHLPCWVSKGIRCIGRGCGGSGWELLQSLHSFYYREASGLWTRRSWRRHVCYQTPSFHHSTDS